MTYNEFIQNIIDTRGQWNIPEGEYWEGHHIIPRCKGGKGNSRKKEPNIIRLYAREHYEAHRLLALENPYDWDIVNAYHCISHMCADTNKRIISAEEYEEARKFMSECIKNSYKYTIECIETGELFKCPSDIKLKYPNIHINHVGQCCRGKRLSTGGFHWRYFNCTEFKQKTVKQLVKDKGPVRCVETGEVFSKIGDIPNIKNYQVSRVLYCCEGKRCTLNNLHWEFVDENLRVPQKIDRRSLGRLNWSYESKVHYSTIMSTVRNTWSAEKSEKEYQRKSKESSKHRWFTNGKERKFCEPGKEPEGFVRVNKDSNI